MRLEIQLSKVVTQNCMQRTPYTEPLWGIYTQMQLNPAMHFLKYKPLCLFLYESYSFSSSKWYISYILDAVISWINCLILMKDGLYCDSVACSGDMVAPCTEALKLYGTYTSFHCPYRIASKVLDILILDILKYKFSTL